MDYKTLIDRGIVEQASVFSDYLLEYLLVQGEIRYQPAQPGIFLLQLPELADLRGREAPNLFFQREKVCSLMPILRVTSATWVPCSACCRAKAICWSVKRDRFIENFLLARFLHLSKILSL